MLKHTLISLTVCTSLISAQAFAWGTENPDQNLNSSVTQKRTKQEKGFDMPENEQRVYEFSNSCFMQTIQRDAIPASIFTDIENLVNAGNHSGLIWAFNLAEFNSPQYNQILEIANSRGDEQFQGSSKFFSFVLDKSGSCHGQSHIFPKEVSLKAIIEGLHNGRASDQM